uniref:Flagellar protein FlaG n=1 Tax=Geobacter metallireducens TaxID=28232 RepID=A0A831UGH0_GEOME
MNIQVNGGIGIVTGTAAPAGVVSPNAPEEEKRASTPVELPKVAVKEMSAAEKEEKVREAAEKINEFIEAMTHDLSFSVDKDTNRTVVKVLERESGEVIRQIPAEEILKIAKMLDELKGLIIREKV